MPSPPSQPIATERTLRQVARILLRQTQPLRREVRRLLRHRTMRTLFGSRPLQYLEECIFCFLDDMFRHRRQPASMLRELETLIRNTLRSVEEESRNGLCPPPADFYDRCTALVESFLCLQTGYFTGTHLHPTDSPTQCSICLYEQNGEGRLWWYSWMCGHSFHVNCIANHLRLDTRCPLCRREFFLE